LILEEGINYYRNVLSFPHSLDSSQSPSHIKMKTTKTPTGVLATITLAHRTVIRLFYTRVVAWMTVRSLELYVELFSPLSSWWQYSCISIRSTWNRNMHFTCTPIQSSR